MSSLIRLVASSPLFTRLSSSAVGLRVESTRQLERSAAAVQRGVRLAIDGVRHGWKNEAVRLSLFRSITYLVITSALLFLLLLVLLLPPTILLWIFNWLRPLSPDTLAHAETFLSPSAWLFWGSHVGAPSIIFFVYTALGYEESFFAMMDSQPKGRELRVQLQAQVKPSLLSSAGRCILRLLPLVLVGLMVSLLQLLPYVHAYVPSLWLLKLSLKLGVLRRDVGLVKRAAVLASLGCIAYFPLANTTCFYLLHTYLATMGLARELLDTYTSRIGDADAKPDAHKDAASDDASPPSASLRSRPASQSQVADESTGASSPSLSFSSPPPRISDSSFVSRHAAVWFGVGLVFILPFRLSSALGVAVAPIAHAAAGYALAQIVQEESDGATAEAGVAAPPTPITPPGGAKVKSSE